MRPKGRPLKYDEKKRHRVVVLPPGTLVLVAIEIDHPKQQPAVQLVRSKPAQPVGESSHDVERRLGQKPQKMSVKVPPNGKRGYLARIWTWNEEESGPE